MPDDPNFVILDSNSPLKHVAQQMFLRQCQYAVVHVGTQCIAYSNDAIAKALGQKLLVLREIVPFHTFEPITREAIQDYAHVFKLRKKVCICTNGHHEESPPAEVGGTCLCGEKYEMCF
jgi:hypothetical protein